ncbi:MAG: redoxin domain-containing protein [Chitinophagaceae bacterium]
MKKRFYIILGYTMVATTILSCNSNSNDKKESTAISKENNSFTLTGKIKGIDSGWVSLVYSKGDSSYVDSAKLNAGTFSFSGSTEYPQMAMLSMKDEANYENISRFYLENSNITAEALKDSIGAAIYKGSATQEEFTKLSGTTKVFEDKMKVLGEVWQNAGTNKKLKDSLSKQADGIQKEEQEVIKKFISDNPNSYVAASKIRDLYSYNPKVPEFEKAYNGLDQSIKNSPLGKKIGLMLEIAQKTDIGKPSIDFTMNDLNGKPVALSSLKGNYVLLDFWASWCGPCRAENPNVKKAYQKFHAKGFEIIGVSMDDSKEDWIKAIKKDGLPWVHVSDLKGWKCEAGKLYGIQGIPMNYLLDKEGKIVAKGLRGEDLEKKLGETLQ